MRKDLANGRLIAAVAGVVLIVVGTVLGIYGSMNAKYVNEKVPIVIIRGVLASYRTESVWTPSPVYWLGLLAIAAGVMCLAYAAFARTKKVAPEIRRRTLEPIPA